MIIRETERPKFRNHSQQRQQSYWQFIIISVNIDFTNQLPKNMLLISLSLAKFARFVDSLFFFASVVVVPVDQSRSKSIKVDNHKKLCDRLLSTSDICRLISIEFDRQRSTFIDYRNYRHVTSCVTIWFKCNCWHAIFVRLSQDHGFDPPCGSHQLPVFLKYSVRLTLLP